MPDKKMSVSEATKILGALSLRWLDPRDSFRDRAVKCLVKKGGYSISMAEAALDATFSELTQKKLWTLLRSEIGNPLYLDSFQRDPVAGRLTFAKAPKTILHILSSNIPNASIWSVVMGLLIQSDNLVKLSQDDSGVLELYLLSLKKASHKLFRRVKRLPASHNAIRPYLRSADVVVCYGADDTVNSVRSQVDPKKIFVGYGHRISFAIILKEALTQKNVSQLASELAKDAWMVDGRGCLSPATVFVESGGEVSVENFEKLFRKKLRHLYEGDASDLRSRSNQVISSLKVPIQAFKSFEQVAQKLKAQSAYLQAVALEGGEARKKQIAARLNEIGFNRICRAGRMQFPPITWHHDGKLNLASWLTWSNQE